MQGEIFHRKIENGTYNVKYTGLLATLMKIIKKEGVGKLFSGLTASLFGLVHAVIHFPVYENLKILCRTKIPSSINEEGGLKISYVLLCSTISKSKINVDWSDGVLYELLALGDTSETARYKTEGRGETWSHLDGSAEDTEAWRSEGIVLWISIRLIPNSAAECDYFCALRAI